jgi:NitT/TauT family transport system permease protein
MGPLNRWDLMALLIILALIALVAYGSHEMASSFTVGQTIPISLDPSHLPYYALRTVLRIFFALFFSLLFTFIFGTWAAKSPRAQKIIIPAIDILQSVPILGFLSISVVGFIALFHGSMLGPECTTIFVIFTSQVWNMALSFYQSIRTVPNDLIEASHMYHLSAWQRFWRVEVPFAMPALLWNTMMSMSGSWFFVVAAEAISVAHQTITLPGIGSYIDLAINKSDSTAIVYAVITMFLVILSYDQLFFRPLVIWAEKFKLDANASEHTSRSWVTSILQHTNALKFLNNFFSPVFDKFINFSFSMTSKPIEREISARRNAITTFFWYSFVFIVIIASSTFLAKYIFGNLALDEVGKVFLYGLATGARVIAAIIFCTLVWVPLGIWIGSREGLATTMQPIMQFLAAFPANLLFPVVVFLIVKYSLNIQIWVTPLMILGTQWYVAFNVIAGTMAIPKELHLAIDNLNISGWLRWKKLMLPAIFPYYVTGAITAVGGAWNVSIVAEFVKWGHNTLIATGVGSYIQQATIVGNFPKVALGVTVMCIYVLLLNRIFWRPLYEFAEKHFRME